MKNTGLVLAMFFFSIPLEAAEESVLYKSRDGKFELVAVKEEKSDPSLFVLRNSKTKTEIESPQMDEDFINSGFGTPTLRWSPTNSRLLIITAKLYRHGGEVSSVFRITDDSKLVQVPIPDDAIPAQWNADGTLILLVRHKETYSFDATKNALVPVKNKKTSP